VTERGDHVTAIDAPQPAPVLVGQVFVDASGRRNGLLSRLASMVGLVSASYVAAVLVCLTQTGAGAIPLVPDIGNGRVAGFPVTTGAPAIMHAAAIPARPAPRTSAASRPASRRALPSRSGKPRVKGAPHAWRPAPAAPRPASRSRGRA
jgi:hypothetical protein